VLEVSLATGGVLGHFDPSTAALFVIDPQDSLAVAAAVAPYLLGREQPLGVQSSQHVAAADALWEILEASPFTWQRFVPLHDRLLFFYCPLVHADSRPGAAPDAEMHRSMWMRLTHG
jgi:hypothetical protein